MSGKDLFLYIFMGTALVGIFALLIYMVIMIDKQQKEEKKAKNDTKNSTYSDDELPEYETVEIHATVVNQSCSAKVVGIRNPKAIKEFFVYFENDNGKKLELSVPEDVYDGFETGMSGILTLVDGQLYSFIPDSE